MLVPHGKDPDLCKWIVENYKDHPIYKNHMTVLEWVKECEEVLEENNDNRVATNS